MNRYLTYIATVTAALAASPVHAAAASDALQPESSIEEIVVTAQKREESLQSIPLSIAAISGEELNTRAKNSIDEVLSDVPGVQIQAIVQGSQVFIRGVGSAISPSYADPSVSLMMDGVYTGRVESVSSGGYDIARIEVVRGPQGTLYGRNATGGVVNVISAPPQLDDYAGVARVQVGDYGLRRAEGALNLPLGDIAALRISGVREQHDSYIDNGGNDADRSGIRAQLLVEPSAGVRLLGKFEYYNAEGFGANSVPVPGSAGQLTFPPFLLQFPDGWVQTTPGDPWSNDVVHSPGNAKSTFHTYQLQADIELSFGDLTILPAYSKQSNVNSSSLLFGDIVPPTTTIGDVKYTSLETRLASKADSDIKWLAGAYYLRTEGNPAIPQSVSGIYSIDLAYEPSKTLALFSQVTVPITDAFRLTGGLRWSRDEQGSTNQIVAPSIDYDSGVLTFSNSDSSVTYKAGLEYDLAVDALLFAHVASGFKQGGLSPNVPPTEFKPEKLTAYEVGLKSRLAGGAVTLNASAFFYDYQDYQIAYLQAVPLGSTGTFYMPYVVDNAKDGEIYGAGIEGSWRPTEYTTLRGSVDYLHARYGELVLPNNPFVNQGPFQLEGREAANSPEWTATVGFDRSWELMGGELILSGDLHYSSSYFASPEEYLPGATQDSYTRSDLSLQFASNDRWSLAAWVKNIENEAQTIFVLPAYRRLVSAPRTYGISSEFRF